jgi:dethiobiotin synthetase
VQGRLIVVTGSGTGIGKTHLTCALTRHGRAHEVVGAFKPIESGVTAEPGDASALIAASHPTFHVKHPRSPYLLRRPVSPHLAAAEEGVTIDPAQVAAAVRAARDLCTVLFVELAGGLFTPLGPALTNAELIGHLDPAAVLLVAPDRLGVLHDVGAVLRAFSRIHAIALVTPELPDASTGTNARELRTVAATAVPIRALPRAPVATLAEGAAVAEIYAALR